MGLILPGPARTATCRGRLRSCRLMKREEPARRAGPERRLIGAPASSVNALRGAGASEAPAPPERPAQARWRASAAGSTLPPLRMTPTRLPSQDDRARKGRGGGEAAGRLDHDLHALDEEAHRREQRLVRDGDDVVDARADDREGAPPERRGQRPVGDRARHRDAHDRAGAERLLAVVRRPPARRRSPGIAGASALAASAQPESRPPPPRQTRRRSRGPTSSISSSAAVPWPAMTSGWSKGGIRRQPALGGEPQRRAPRDPACSGRSGRPRRRSRASPRPSSPARPAA